VETNGDENALTLQAKS